MVKLYDTNNDINGDVVIISTDFGEGAFVIL